MTNAALLNLCGFVIKRHHAQVLFYKMYMFTDKSVKLIILRDNNTNYDNKKKPIHGIYSQFTTQIIALR